ncbi:cell division protein FtsQ [Afipia sp. P52-10]|jgi:cell division protein FtsQ|uniref:cell division protein FtsQ/DivIB n=1 Tax=Afipia sp. P52-10 TaxID=1429916 RepID=UPI0003DF2E44|nr:cell division protein FtsQ/DivIB [Afipia sp. P52-10]ETR78855.1 cell division protein FtsQ [Afipia sp. P52-10]
MGGGGRFAGSLRQGAKSVLSWAVQALRRKPDPVRIRSTSDNRFIAMIEQRLPRNVGSVATLLILTGSLCVGVVRGGHVEYMVEAMQDARDAMANAAGFRIARVAINGRKNLSQDEVLAIGGITGRRSLLFLDAAEVRDKLKATPWVADATVLKLYPDTIQIDLVERAPFALWQRDGNVSVISETGMVLQPYTPGPFRSLPLVVGKGADSRAKDFLALLGQYPQIRSQVKAIIFVSERRWNLRLADGIDVRLPEAGVERALATLTKLDRDEKLFSRDITAVDLRLPDRLTVRLSEDAAKARADMLKDREKARKRKANEA